MHVYVRGDGVRAWIIRRRLDRERLGLGPTQPNQDLFIYSEVGKASGVGTEAGVKGSVKKKCRLGVSAFLGSSQSRVCARDDKFSIQIHNFFI